MTIERCLLEYQQIYQSVFSVEADDIESLVYGGIAEWDSVGHFNLMSQVEATYHIKIDQDVIVSWMSYIDGIEILRKRNISLA